MHLLKVFYDDPYDGYRDKEFFFTNKVYLKRNDISIDWYIPERNQIWHQTYFARQAVMDHQAKGNCRFAMLCLEYMEEQGWLKGGDIILDPMCGIGSFPMMAALRGYNAIGVELEKVYYDDMMGFEKKTEDTIVRAPKDGEHDNLFAGLSTHIEGSIEKFRRVTKDMVRVGIIQIVQHDARDLPNISAECRSLLHVLNSPPYTSGTEQTESQAAPLDQTGHKEHIYNHGDNIARLEASEYSVEMLKVYKSLYSVLSGGSYVCLITRNFIQKFKIIKLDDLTIRLMEQAGFKYITTKRASLPEVSCLKITNWKRYFKRRNLPMIDWEEATFYVKENDNE